MIQCLLSLKKKSKSTKANNTFLTLFFHTYMVEKERPNQGFGRSLMLFRVHLKKIKKRILQSLWEFFLCIFLLQNCSSIARIWSSPQTNEIQMTAIQMVTTWGFKTRENGVFFLIWLIYSSDFSFSRSSCQISPGILKTQPHHTAAVDLLAARLWWESSSPPHLVLYWIAIW